MQTPRILIIVPAYNEGGNITKAVEEILSSPRALEVLIIDDGSTDETLAKARRTKARVVSLPFNVGIGGAVQTGFRYARQEDFDIAVQMDGDGQHDAGYLEKLLLPLINGEADMVVGSRFLPPFLGYRSSFIRRVGINFFARLISFLTGFDVTDPTSGFRAYNKKMIAVFAEYYPIDFPEPEAIMIARQAGARLREVPVQMRKRESGRSSIRYFATLYYMIKVTFAILLNRLKKKRKVAQYGN